MKLAIDIDGTITRYPELFRDMISLYPDAVILTGYAGVDFASRRQCDLVASRRLQLAPYIGDVSNQVVVCVGISVAAVATAKGSFCRDNNIDAIIDDSKEYCAAVRQISPRTAVLQVHP